MASLHSNLLLILTIIINHILFLCVFNGNLYFVFYELSFRVLCLQPNHLKGCPPLHISCPAAWALSSLLPGNCSRQGSPVASLTVNPVSFSVVVLLDLLGLLVPQTNHHVFCFCVIAYTVPLQAVFLRPLYCPVLACFLYLEI